MSKAENSNYEKGISNLDKMLAEGRTQYIVRLDGLCEGLGEAVVEQIYGKLYSNDVLDLKTRQLITIALLLGNGDDEQFSFHIKCAFKLGATEEQIIEVIKQGASIIGVPKALHALKVVKEFVESKL